MEHHKKYKIIYADPPWSYADKGCQGTMANHYNGMELESIKKLPINEIADNDSILFLWATYPMLKEALAVIEAWGFTYKSIAFQWVKQNKKNGGFFYGLGRWTRGNTECCLLATKGKPKRVSNSVFQLVLSPLRMHSQKPDEVRDLIIKLMGDLPRIELFAREKVEGWDCWGNEVESDVQLIAKSKTQGVLTEPSFNRNLKENSAEFSQIEPNGSTSLNSDIKSNQKRLPSSVK